MGTLILVVSLKSIIALMNGFFLIINTLIFHIKVFQDYAFLTLVYLAVCKQITQFGVRLYYITTIITKKLSSS